jgi:hypothetical protein
MAAADTTRRGQRMLTMFERTIRARIGQKRAGSRARYTALVAPAGNQWCRIKAQQPTIVASVTKIATSTSCPPRRARCRRCQK